MNDQNHHGSVIAQHTTANGITVRIALSSHDLHKLVATGTVDIREPENLVSGAGQVTRVVIVT